MSKNNSHHLKKTLKETERLYQSMTSPSDFREISPGEIEREFTGFQITPFSVGGPKIKDPPALLEVLEGTAERCAISEPDFDGMQRRQLYQARIYFSNLAKTFKKSIYDKQRLYYCIQSATSSDLSGILPGHYQFDPYTDYAYIACPLSSTITLRGFLSNTDFSEFQQEDSESPTILTIVQKQAAFSPSHIEIYFYDSHLTHKYCHLSSLNLSAVKKYCSSNYLAYNPVSLQRFLLRQAMLLWGIVPSYLPKGANPTVCFHPVTAKIWRDELNRRMNLQEAFPFATAFDNDLEEYANRFPFYENETDGYMHPSPPVLQFLMPYVEPPSKKLFSLITKRCFRSKSVCFVLTELIYLHFLELGLFGRGKRILDQDKMIFCCSGPLSERLHSLLPPEAFLRISSQHDLERATSRARSQAGKKVHRILCLSCTPQYAKQFTFYELLPFLHNCQFLILCGATAPDECCTLPLSSDLFADTQEMDFSVFDAQFSHALQSLLQYCLNRLLFQRYQAIHQKMISSSFEGLRFTPPPADTVVSDKPLWETPEYRTAERCDNYASTIEQNAALAKKAATRIDTLLIPFRNRCRNVPKAKRLIRNREIWEELLTCGLFLDHIIAQGTEFHFDAPDTCHVVSSLMDPPSPPPQNLFDRFCHFVRTLPLCDSPQTYFAQREAQNACLGWKDCDTIYLDYDRFWSSFCSFASLPDEQIDGRNRFLREQFRPGMPGGRYAYATDSRDGHWGHRIRKSKNEAPLGRFLRLRIEILQE